MGTQVPPAHAVRNLTRQRRILSLLVYIFTLVVAGIASFVEASSSPVLTPHREATMATEDPSPSDKEIHIVFSDIDGTLVHYPAENNLEMEEGNRILQLPPSATGMRGITSSRTFVYCRELRREQKLVLISGMRTATLLKRLPYLPRADAYCTYRTVDSNALSDEHHLFCSSLLQVPKQEGAYSTQSTHQAQMG